jgi:hypothetical protein
MAIGNSLHFIPHHYMQLSLPGLTVLVTFATQLAALCCRLNFSAFIPTLIALILFSIFIPSFFDADGGRNQYLDGRSTHSVAPERSVAALERLITTPITSIILLPC